jgi:hypothetical protein
VNTFVGAKLVFFLVVGLASFGGAAVSTRLFANQPERSRACRGWILALILALSCAWLNGGWPIVPRESQQWIGYMVLLAAILQSFAFSRARLFCSAISAVFAIAVTLIPIAQSALGLLGTSVWFLGSLISYLLVRTVLQPEFNTVASLRAPVLLCLPLICSGPMLFFGGSAMFAELAVVGAIAVVANYLAAHSTALGAPFAEAALLFYFLLLLNGTTYADLHPAFAWLQWVVPALGTLLPKLLLRLSSRSTQRDNELATIASVTAAQAIVGLIFYFVTRPTLPF